MKTSEMKREQNEECFGPERRKDPLTGLAYQNKPKDKNATLHTLLHILKYITKTFISLFIFIIYKIYYQISFLINQTKLSFLLPFSFLASSSSCPSFPSSSFSMAKHPHSPYNDQNAPTLPIPSSPSLRAFVSM